MLVEKSSDSINLSFLFLCFRLCQGLIVQAVVSKEIDQGNALLVEAVNALKAPLPVVLVWHSQRNEIDDGRRLFLVQLINCTQFSHCPLLGIS